MRGKANWEENMATSLEVRTVGSPSCSCYGLIHKSAPHVVAASPEEGSCSLWPHLDPRGLQNQEHIRGHQYDNSLV